MASYGSTGQRGASELDQPYAIEAEAEAEADGDGDGDSDRLLLSENDGRLVYKTRHSTEAQGGEKGNSISVFNLFSIVAVAVTLIVITASLVLNMRSSSQDAGDTSADASDDDSLAFTLYNVNYPPLDYFTSTNDDFIPSYEVLDGFDGILEPAQPTSLYIYAGNTNNHYESFNTTVCPRVVNSDSDCAYFESFGDPDIDSVTDSAQFSLSCEANKDFHVTVTAYDSLGNNATFTGKVKCMYVRREIRTLTDEDLQRTLDAMFMLYNTSDTDGLSAFGSNFLSNNYLTRMHHYNSALQDADHIHEGNGFLAQHIKMSNMMEKSMQAVDPSVTLPYWDYTIDYAEGTEIYNSFVFTSDVFGSMNLPANLMNGFTYTDDSIISGAIPDSRWAFLKADSNPYDDLLYGYSYLRAPWNMNPSPYVSRFPNGYTGDVTLPTCSSHYSVLKKLSLMEFSYDIAYAPHAGPHSLSGGTYGCDLFRPMYDAGYIDSDDKMYSLCAKWLFLLKEFYRSNNFVPNADCVATSDTDTTAPSLAPTTRAVPSQAPTKMPTKMPTKVPTKAPTRLLQQQQQQQQEAPLELSSQSLRRVLTGHATDAANSTSNDDDNPLLDKVNVQGSFCGFTCPSSMSEKFLANIRGKLSGFVPAEMREDENHNGWTAWQAFICTGDGSRIFSGENLESASPADPSFWVIHPTLERLYHAKMLTGGFHNADWTSDSVGDYVCDKAECYQDGSLDYFLECCDGHYEDSQLIDVKGDRCSYFGQTNGDTILSTDAGSDTYGMAYIYDSFTWEHCKAQGYDFSSLLESLAANADDDATDEPTESPTEAPSSSSKHGHNDDDDNDNGDDDKGHGRGRRRLARGGRGALAAGAGAGRGSQGPRGGLAARGAQRSPTHKPTQRPTTESGESSICSRRRMYM